MAEAGKPHQDTSCQLAGSGMCMPTKQGNASSVGHAVATNKGRAVFAHQVRSLNNALIALVAPFLWPSRGT